MIEGLSHITFVVRDLDRMSEIVREVLGGVQVYESGAATFSLSPERFFVAGGVWIAIMQGDALLARSYNHVAFKVTDTALARAVDAISRLGLSMKPPRPRVDGEAQSVYFYDDDNHLFELHTGTLDERLARYAKGKML